MVINMKTYAQVLNGVLHWKFQQDDAPEFAENIKIVDISSISPKPEEGWLFDDATGKFTAPAGPSVAALRAAKGVEINAACQAVADQLTAGYPDFEMMTWPQQEAEALAWSKDKVNTVTPMVDMMALNRGIAREVYLQKTLDKVLVFRDKSAKLVGQRQKYSDKVGAATTSEAVAAIVPVFNLA